MRSSRLISSLAVVSLFTILSCTRDPAPKQPREEAPSQEPRSATLAASAAIPSSPDVEVASAADPAGEVASLAASCSIVQFCNAPGSDGTRCQQQGCSLGAAENECKREVRTVCGSASCPLIFVTSSKDRITLGCAATVCPGNAIECGGHCCGSNAKFCSGTRCCDGIHCGGGCPC